MKRRRTVYVTSLGQAHTLCARQHAYLHAAL